MEEYVVIVTSQGRATMKDEPRVFDKQEYTFNSLDEAKGFIEDNWNGRKGKAMYVDLKDGDSKEIGRIYSYWNRDISHNSKAWFQDDWVEMVKRKVEIERVEDWWK